MSRPEWLSAETGAHRFNWLGWVLVAGVVLCLASIVTLTMLLPGPGSYPPNGGFLPLSTGK